MNNQRFFRVLACLEVELVSPDSLVELFEKYEVDSVVVSSVMHWIGCKLIGKVTQRSLMVQALIDSFYPLTFQPLDSPRIDSIDVKKALTFTSDPAVH